ncbi:MAG TPA: hypothetical protein VJT09_18195 [Pyrinomonadaceae bacterium]|nr:hypothetical protein [Pyrinomonadaceae bacterium]
MGKNTGEGYRQGAVKNRTQTENPQTGDWTKRNREDGEFTAVKKNGEPFKGVAKEPDGRQDET